MCIRGIEARLNLPLATTLLDNELQLVNWLHPTAMNAERPVQVLNQEPTKLVVVSEKFSRKYLPYAKAEQETAEIMASPDQPARDVARIAEHLSRS